jgi:SAM-dependent methyltransferase
MNFIKEIKGLKFPDLYIVKFFFKENLDKLEGNVLELGCGNGNNLALFYSYGYNVYGIDVDRKSLEYANYNFSKIFLSEYRNEFVFHRMDIKDLSKTFPFNVKFDILLLPNIIYYISKSDFVNLLNALLPYLKSKGKFFIRFRSPRDMRVALGKKIGENEYLIDTDITGEKNALLTVYEESEIILLLKNFLKINNCKIFHLYEENFHKDRKILNADIVIWGNFFK